VAFLDKRISPSFNMAELSKVLETISDRERFQAAQLITTVLQKPLEQASLTCDDIASIIQKVPNFALPTVSHLRPWISTELDFTRVNKILEFCADKNNRIEILGELVSISTQSPPQLRCNDIRNVLITLGQRFAEKGLKILSRLVLPDLDLHRIELVFECVMKTDQVKVLSTLLGTSQCLISSMNDIRAIIEKMDQPFKGLEVLLSMDRIDPAIDLNKLSMILSYIPTIRRLEVIQTFCERTSANSSSQLSTFDLRSILMLMEATTIVGTLRLLLNKYEPSSARDKDRILECFSEANKPNAELILKPKFPNSAALSSSLTNSNSNEYIH